MTDFSPEFEAALDRLRDMAADPSEFVIVGDKRVRATNMLALSPRLAKDRRYRSKHQQQRVADVKEWKKQNPDLVRAQKDRRSNNDYHRPFIAIDAEGRDFPGHDEVDAKGNVYPLHRTILWGAAGWQRDFSAEDLKEGRGNPRKGRNTEAYWLVSEDGKPLSSIEIIEWLLSLPSMFGKEQGFPDGVNFVSFASNYDATQVIADLPYKKVKQITRRRTAAGIKTNAPVLCGGYAIDYMKGKWLRLWKLHDPNKPYKDKLDKNGNVIIGANGRPVKEIDAIAYISIEDAFGFYQRKFTTVSESLVSQGYITEEDHETIVRNKGKRDEFASVPIEEIKHYCHLELLTLSKALTVLRDGFDKMDIRLRTWSGAGSASAALIRKEDLKDQHYSPDIDVRDISPQQEHAHHAFVGGRIEAIKQGAAR